MIDVSVIAGTNRLKKMQRPRRFYSRRNNDVTHLVHQYLSLAHLSEEEFAALCDIALCSLPFMQQCSHMVAMDRELVSDQQVARRAAEGLIRKNLVKVVDEEFIRQVDTWLAASPAFTASAERPELGHLELTLLGACQAIFIEQMIFEVADPRGLSVCHYPSDGILDVYSTTQTGLAKILDEELPRGAIFDLNARPLIEISQPSEIGPWHDRWWSVQPAGWTARILYAEQA